MKRYLLYRLALLLPTLFGVLTLVFLFIHLTPGDPVDIPKSTEVLFKVYGT
jgi:ABC-type microcin C transport system permease subunit YejB